MLEKLFLAIVVTFSIHLFAQLEGSHVQQEQGIDHLPGGNNGALARLWE